MTGATDVQLLLSDETGKTGCCRPQHGTVTVGAGPVSSAGHERAGPMSVLRYIQRTREPLVASDVTRDDRFARDPYFADVTCCSLLALPVLSRGVLRAVLLLENQPSAARSPPDGWRRSSSRRPARRLPGQRPAVRRVPPDRRGAGGAAAGSDAGGPGDSAGAGVRRGRRGGRRAAGGRLHGPDPVRSGGHDHGRRRVDCHRRRPAEPGRQPVRARRPEREHADAEDRPARPAGRLRRRHRQHREHWRSRLGFPLVGGRADQRRGAAVGPHPRGLHPRPAAARPIPRRASRVHRAGRDRDRQHREPRLVELGLPRSRRRCGGWRRSWRRGCRRRRCSPRSPRRPGCF